MSAFPLASLERILKENGAQRVSRNACVEFSIVLEEMTIHLSKEAAGLAEHAGRRTVNGDDVKLAKKRGLTL